MGGWVMNNRADDDGERATVTILISSHTSLFLRPQAISIILD